MELYTGATIDIPKLDIMENILNEARSTLAPGLPLAQASAIVKATAAFVGYGVRFAHPVNSPVPNPVRSMAYHALADIYHAITKGDLQERVESLRQYFHDAFVVQVGLQSDAALRGVWADIQPAYESNVQALDDLVDEIGDVRLSEPGNC